MADNSPRANVSDVQINIHVRISRPKLDKHMDVCILMSFVLLY